MLNVLCADIVRVYDNLTIGIVKEAIINFNDLLDSCKGTLTIP